MLEIRLLGRFDVRWGGEPVEILSRPAQSLLAYLVLNAGVACRREKLAGLLWPDSDEPSARNNLRQALWRLRKAIERDPGAKGAYLTADSSTVVFNADSDYRLDAALLGEPVPEDSSADALIEVISPHTGELLPGFYEDWIALERERLRAAFEHKMQMLLVRLVEEGRWRETLEWGERWVALGQTPEPAFRALMAAHGALGDVSSVVAVYGRCQEALREELGVEPSAETRHLYQRLISGEMPAGRFPDLPRLAAERAPRRIEVSPMGPPAFLTEEGGEAEDETGVFVARERELACLDQFLQKALAGRGQVAFISGDAGSGKTALAKAFARRAIEADPDLIVTMGNCDALTGVGDPYLPFREAAELLTGDVEAKWAGGAITRLHARRLWRCLPEAVQAMVEKGPDLIGTLMAGEALLARAASHESQPAGWLPALEGLVTRKAEERGSVDMERKDLHRQYVQVLGALARRRPLLLVLDDLQWADVGSIDLLFHLGRELAEHRIMVLGAYRGEEIAAGRDGGRHPLAKVLTEFKRTFGEVQIDLGQVNQADEREFVVSLLDTEPNRLGEGFRQALVRHTGGHPLFTVELLRAMEARCDILHDEAGRWVEGPALSWEALPPRIEGVIEERLGQLDQPSLEILTAASVEGETFTAETVAQVLGADAREVVTHLDRELGRHHRLVVAQGARRLGNQRLSVYRFRHILFQKHLYRNLGDAERAYYHEHIGRSLEALYGPLGGEVVVQLAHHFAEARVAEKAVSYLQQAADRAKRLSANEEAIAYLNRGLELLEAMPEGPDRIQKELGLQISLGAPLIAIRGYGAPEVEQAFGRARALCRRIGDDPQHFPVLHVLRTFYLIRAKHAEARDLAERLFVLAGDEDDPALFLEAHEAMGTTLFYQGEVVPAQEHLDHGVALYDRERHRPHAFLFGQDPGVACLSYSALASWLLGYPDRAEARSEQALTLAREGAHPFSLALALVFAALLHALRREGEMAQEIAEEAIALSAQHGFPVWLAGGTILRGGALAERGRLAEGIAEMRQGLRAWQATGAALARPHFLYLLAAALGAAGRLDEGLRVVAEALDSVEGSGERVNLAELIRLEGELLRAQGRDEVQVGACYRRALKVAKEQGSNSFALRAALSLCRLQSGGPEGAEARRVLSQIHAGFTEGFGTDDLMEASALLASDR